MIPGAAGPRNRRDFGRATSAPGAVDPGAAAGLAEAAAAGDPGAAAALAAAPAPAGDPAAAAALVAERDRAVAEAAAARAESVRLAAEAAARAAVLRGTPFTPDIINAVTRGIGVSGYELAYTVYNNSLKPSLINHYSVPVEEPAAAKPKKDTSEPTELTGEALKEGNRINGVMLAQTIDDPTTKNAPKWNTERRNSLYNKAIRSPKVLEQNSAVPFNLEKFKKAMRKFINDPDNQRAVKAALTPVIFNF
jgi:hypothetical protein